MRARPFSNANRYNYGLTQALSQAGYYESEHHQQLIKDIKGAVIESS